MRKILFVAAIACLAVFTSAQDLSKLTPEQQSLYKKYTESSSMKTTGNVLPDTIGERKLVDEMPAKTAVRTTVADKKDPKTLKIFGADLFTTTGLTFDPKMNIPTPKNYILGTNDEMIVDLSGHYDANYRLKVSPDGTIRIPTVGPVKVGGQTVEAATRSIRNAVERVYPSVASASTSLSVTLGNIRSIRVVVIGAASRPGTYTLPSLATVINALYVCGGPSATGSMRDIRVIRKGNVVARVDLYEFLQNGILKDNIVLQDEDVLKIQPYQNRLRLTGEVKMPAIFEARTGESVQDVLDFAGGYTENANTAMLTIFRIQENKRKVMNVYPDQLADFPVKSGDSIAVSPVYNAFQNRIELRGAIFNPGFYAIENTPTLKTLLSKADGLTPEAMTDFGFIIRKRENDQPLILGFNPANIISGKDVDIQLYKEDKVEIQSLKNYTEAKTISVWGSVKAPGTYPYYDNMQVRDLIYRGKGFAENAATDTIELVRLVKDPLLLKQTNKRSEIIKVPVSPNMDAPGRDGRVVLEHGDQIIVRKISQLDSVKIVRVEGEVYNPGDYNLLTTKDKLTDVLSRTGGFTPDAYLKGAYLLRKEKKSDVDAKLDEIMVENTKNLISGKESTELDVKQMSQAGLGLQSLNADSLESIFGDKNLAKEIRNTEGLVGINLESIMKNPSLRSNLILEAGDIIYIPKVSQTVRVSGQVLFPTYVAYAPGMGLGEFVSRAGGFADNADRDKTFVLYPNGTAKNTRKFLFFRNYPSITPGSKIIVPQKPIELKNQMSTGETVAIFTSVTSMLALIYSILVK